MLKYLEKLGLSQNESRIYTGLLKIGEANVRQIAEISKVHRRNVYDALNRLLEKGLVVEIIESQESRYQSVDPNKLSELVDEDEQVLTRALPELTALYEQTPDERQAFVYRGVGGWKRYMRDILRVGEDVLVIAGKGAWLDMRLRKFLPWFISEAKKMDIVFYHLFDYEVKEANHDILNEVDPNYRFLPKGYSSSASIDIFGNHITIEPNQFNKPLEDDFLVSVTIDQRLASSFRQWFWYLWEHCSEK